MKSNKREGEKANNKMGNRKKKKIKESRKINKTNEHEEQER